MRQPLRSLPTSGSGANFPRGWPRRGAGSRTGCAVAEPILPWGEGYALLDQRVGGSIPLGSPVIRAVGTARKAGPVRESA
jgi:hypothetical protein